MAKRFLSIGAAVALALGASVAGATAASAAKPVVNASGSLHCTITGKVKVAPTPLTFGGPATPTTMTAKIKSGTCTGSSGVTSFKGNYIANLPTSDCTALAISTFPPSSITNAKLKGASKYNLTTLSFSTATFTAANPITFDAPGAGTSSASGSFAGQEPTVHLTLDQSAETFATNCQPKTKGVKGSGGLKKMSFSGGSYIDIPA
jgi:hypothetical protein